MTDIASEAVDPLQVAAEADSARPSTKLPPGQWAKKNLFGSAGSSVVTVVLGALSAYFAYRLFRFVFITGRWDPVITNLRLFMVGNEYPWDDESWRLVVQAICTAFGLGALVGTARAGAIVRAEQNGVPYEKTPLSTYVQSYWALGVLGVVLLSLTRTTGPLMLAAACAVAAVVGWAATAKLRKSLLIVGYTVGILAIILGFQALSGSGGLAWIYTALALSPLVGGLVVSACRSLSPSIPLAIAGAGAAIGVLALVLRPGIPAAIALLIGAYGLVTALQGDRLDGARVGAAMITGLIAFFIYRAIGLDGIDWAKWGGFHLNLVATTVSIGLAFPLGVMLAFGRRSKLPAVKTLSVLYIEFFRGAPLITFLLSAQFFLGFFLNSDNPLSLITRAIAAITLFSAAYVAEIVRGGLQSVDRGQTEAGQAMGLSNAKIMRLIILPQALRAVIPAMVGQFISLFKDTSLLAIIAINELLRIRFVVHGQADFRGFGIGETLAFVALGFWAIAFTMSRESQRLERRLAVGHR